MSANEAIADYVASRANGPTVPPTPGAGVVLAGALAWQGGACSVIPVKEDGSKEPDLLEWTSRKSTRATEAEVRRWFETGRTGLGVVCGAVSGNLEMFELEGRAVREDMLPKIRALVPADLWERFGTYRERTPSGGIHVLVRVEGVAVPGNLRLARRPSTEQERDAWRVKEHRKAAQLPEPKRSKRMAFLEKLTCEQVPQVLAETRGEGGFVVVAPSGGRVHDTGKAWELIPPARAGIVGTITADERDVLLEAFRSVDQMPKPKPAAPREPAPAPVDGEQRPGDAYATAMTWHDLLEEHGWTVNYERGGVTYWTRPGKTFGTSATTGYGEHDLLYVYTSSTEFEPERTYTKFGAYAVLNHDGDHAAAAAQLRRDGYGTDRPRTGAAGKRDPFEEAQANAPAGEQGEWEQPLPLGRTPAPAFPVEALPPVLAEYVTAEATATQTPADLAGVLSILAVATAAAGKYRVHVRGDWTEPVNLYALVSLPPGSRKSAVFKGATAPLQAAERALMEREGPSIRIAQQRQRILNAALDKSEREAAKNIHDIDAQAAAEGAAKLLAEHEVPPIPRLLADDVTPEALVGLLADHVCLGLLSEEGGIFETIGGRYANGVANLDAVLKAWDGGDIRVDRKGSEPRRVKDAALTLGLTVQPAVLASMSKVPDFTGRGLVQRFLYAMPDMAERIGHRQIDPEPVPQAVRDAYEATVYLHATAPRPGVPVPLTLSAEAAAAFRGFRHELEPRRNPDTGDLADVVEWTGKLEGLTARLAGLLHLAREGAAMASTTITGQDMANAITLARYAIPHAQAAHDLMSGRENNGPARSLLRVIAAKRLEEFSVRDLHKLVEGQTSFRKVDAVLAGLLVLVEAGYLRALPQPEHGRGRPPSPRFEVNPLWLARTGTR
ncbi:MAG: DUF3987 domain-containing protein [Actinobacteria bacterium]|nr:DUF3987 domain-containing protein [Actinomycetota bacterium]